MTCRAKYIQNSFRGLRSRLEHRQWLFGQVASSQEHRDGISSRVWWNLLHYLNGVISKKIMHFHLALISKQAAQKYLKLKLLMNFKIFCSIFTNVKGKIKVITALLKALLLRTYL